jgi:transcription antitermination factor NusG
MALQHGKWYGLQVVPKREFVAEVDLKNRGYEVFLPTMRRFRRWSDRIKAVAHPMLPGYIFCRYDGGNRHRMVDSSVVVRLVGFGGVVMPINDEEMESVRILSDSGCNVQPHHELVNGQKVIVLSGPLMGAQGIFVEGGGDEDWMFVQVTLFQRSVRVRVERDAVAAVSMRA